jgi:two-component system response regulator HydG
VGGTQERHVELRVVAATNADLMADVRAGRFREDLFYRLNVATFTLPPLREIRDDIPELARHFVGRAAEYFRKPEPDIDPGCLDRVKSYEWPGNVRELRNAVERALIFHRGGLLRLDPPTAGAVAAAEAPAAPGGGGEGAVLLPAGLTLEEVERRYIQATLATTGGEVAVAAERLGVTRKVLWNRRKKLGLLP